MTNVLSVTESISRVVPSSPAGTPAVVQYDNITKEDGLTSAASFFGGVVQSAEPCQTWPRNRGSQESLEGFLCSDLINKSQKRNSLVANLSIQIQNSEKDYQMASKSKPNIEPSNTHLSTSFSCQNLQNSSHNISISNKTIISPNRHIIFSTFRPAGNNVIENHSLSRVRRQDQLQKQYSLDRVYRDNTPRDVPTNSLERVYRGTTPINVPTNSPNTVYRDTTHTNVPTNGLERVNRDTTSEDITRDAATLSRRGPQVIPENIVLNSAIQRL